MALFRAEVDVAAPSDEAFGYLRDPVNRAEWDPSVRSVEVDSVGADDGVRLTVGFYGRAIQVEYALVDSEPGTRLEFAIDGKVRGRETFVLTPTGSGTRIEMVLEIGLRGPARVLDRGLQLAVSGIGENAASGFAKVLGSRRVGGTPG